jgi:hypothetical protein
MGILAPFLLIGTGTYSILQYLTVVPVPPPQLTGLLAEQFAGKASGIASHDAVMRLIHFPWFLFMLFCWFGIRFLPSFS